MIPAAAIVDPLSVGYEDGSKLRLGPLSPREVVWIRPQHLGDPAWLTTGVKTRILQGELEPPDFADANPDKAANIQNLKDAIVNAFTNKSWFRDDYNMPADLSQERRVLMLDLEGSEAWWPTHARQTRHGWSAYGLSAADYNQAARDGIRDGLIEGFRLAFPNAPIGVYHTPFFVDWAGAGGAEDAQRDQEILELNPWFFGAVDVLWGHFYPQRSTRITVNGNAAVSEAEFRNWARANARAVGGLAKSSGLKWIAHTWHTYRAPATEIVQGRDVEIMLEECEAAGAWAWAATSSLGSANLQSLQAWLDGHAAKGAAVHLGRRGSNARGRASNRGRGR